MRADRFEKTIDHKIIFQRETELSGESTFDHRVFDDPQHKHFGNAATAILFDHAKRDKPGGSRAALVVKKLSKRSEERRVGKEWRAGREGKTGNKKRKKDEVEERSE